jgi:hypothetical protein
MVKLSMDFRRPTNVPPSDFSAQVVMEGYSKISALLSDFLKRNKPWSWMNKCQLLFYELENRLVSMPMLKFSDFIQYFEVHIDASDFTIGGFLS